MNGMSSGRSGAERADRSYERHVEDSARGGHRRPRLGVAVGGGEHRILARRPASQSEGSTVDWLLVERDRRQRLVGPDDAAKLMKVGRVLLCLSGGGARRATVRPDQFVLAVDVAVRTPRSEAVLHHDRVFDGPTAMWPKGSETLLRFAEPLLGDDPEQFPTTALQQAMELATTAWNASPMRRT